MARKIITSMCLPLAKLAPCPLAKTCTWFTSPTGWPLKKPVSENFSQLLKKNGEPAAKKKTLDENYFELKKIQYPKQPLIKRKGSAAKKKNGKWPLKKHLLISTSRKLIKVTQRVFFETAENFRQPFFFYRSPCINGF